MPVTVTAYKPAEPEHDKVDRALVVLALRATLVCDRVQARPVGGEAVTVSEIVPLNPWRPVVVIDEVPDVPARSVTFVWFAAMAKSWIV